MQLDQLTWQEVDSYLKLSDGIIIPTGSTEQHGPMGLIGTDSLCAEHVSRLGGDAANAIVAPTFSYTPAPFNMGFPGTISISAGLFEMMLIEVLESLMKGGFSHIYFMNGHGANLAPIQKAISKMPALTCRIRSWWEFEPVALLRQKLYGDWEGMHATPSEISLTQAIQRIVPPDNALYPPEKLSFDYIRAHSGDRHGPPDEHRKQFPDGRVGSHSALATPKDGQTLIDTAVGVFAADYLEFINS
jgi:creatinine amidohydrolase